MCLASRPSGKGHASPPGVHVALGCPAPGRGLRFHEESWVGPQVTPKLSQGRGCNKPSSQVGSSHLRLCRGLCPQGKARSRRSNAPVTRRFQKIHVKDTAPGTKRPHFRTSSTVTAIGGAGRALSQAAQHCPQVGPSRPRHRGGLEARLPAAPSDRVLVGASGPAALVAPTRSLDLARSPLLGRRHLPPWGRSLSPSPPHRASPVRALMMGEQAPQSPR